MKRFSLLLLSALLIACQTTTDTTPPAVMEMTADQRMEASARSILTNLTAGRYAEAAKDFDATMMEKLGPTKLEELTKQLNAQLGAFKSVGAAQFSDEGGYRVVTLPVSYANANVSMRVVYNADGKVAGLFVRPAQ